MQSGNPTRRSRLIPPSLAASLVVTAALLPLARSQPPTNRPPTVTVTITPPVHHMMDVTNGPRHVVDVIVEIAIDDSDHDRVSARLLLGPPGFDMEPIVDAPTPFVRRVRWNPEDMAGGREYILVEAHDDVVPARVVRARGAVDLPGEVRAATMRWMDVDGDLQPELVAVVGDQPVGSIAGAGALAVYDHLVAEEQRNVAIKSAVQPATGAATVHPPIALRGGGAHYFTAAAPAQDEHLGVVAASCPIQQADLDGDGILDLVAMSAKNGGTIHVWFGGPLKLAARPADATLECGPFANLGADYHALLVRFRDVTGDGIEDVVVSAPYDASIASGAGAIHVFAGGPTMVGNVGPTATLRLAAPAAGDLFGHDITFGDVTGDGVDDVVAVAFFAAWNGSTDHGVMAVFAGGAGLVGAVQPLAVFSSTAKRFGDCEITPTDVTGDGIADVVVPVQQYFTFTGRICVWNGGPTLVGTPAESAILNDPTAAIHDSDGLEVAVVDVTGDGVCDVVDLRPKADLAGLVDAGVAHVWAGGAGLSGTVNPTATLGTTIAAANNEFGSGGGGMRFFDADRDGVLDVVVPSADFAVSGVARAGALHLWHGGATLSGTPAPDARLTAPIPVAGDELTNYGVVTELPAPVQIVDVTGDGLEDFVAGAYLADVNGVADAGAIQVFDGASLSGNVVSIATLERATPFGPDRLGNSDSRTQHGFRIVDVTGDGIADVVAIAPNASVNKYGDQRGALCMWKGGPGLQGVLTPFAAMAGENDGDQLGSAAPAFQTGDMDGDGILDLVVAAALADDQGVKDVGLAYVVSGGPSLSGTIVPRSRLARRTPQPDDLLFGNPSWIFFGVGSALLRVVDFDRDGRADVIGATPSADDDANADVGMFAWWPNGSEFLPERGPLEVWPQPGFADERFGD